MRRSVSSKGSTPVTMSRKRWWRRPRSRSRAAPATTPARSCIEHWRSSRRSELATSPFGLAPYSRHSAPAPDPRDRGLTRERGAPQLRLGRLGGGNGGRAPPLPPSTGPVRVLFLLRRPSVYRDAPGQAAGENV